MSKTLSVYCSIDGNDLSQHIPGLESMKWHDEGTSFRHDLVVNAAFAMSEQQIAAIVERDLVFYPFTHDGKVTWTLELAAAYAREFNSHAVPCVGYVYHADIDGLPVRKVVFLGYFAPLNN